MSGPSVEEKLQQSPTTPGTRPRATLEQLRARYGFETSDKEAESVHIISMGKTELWVRLSGKGPDAPPRQRARRAVRVLREAAGVAMTGADLSTLKAVALRHVEQHGRVPAHMVLKLVAAFEERLRELEGPPVSGLNTRKQESARGGVA